MGYSLSWLAIHGKPPAEILSKLGFRKTGSYEEYPKSRFCAITLPGDWFVIITKRREQVVPDKTLAELSASGCNLVTCFVEDHVMARTSSGWQSGRRVWSIEYFNELHGNALKTEGVLPDFFPEVQRHFVAEQQSQPDEEHLTDYISEIPIEVACRLTGFRHDQGLLGDPNRGFEVLKRISIVRSIQNFFQR